MDESNFHFFYGGVFSQWSPHGFYDFTGHYYNCAEQYMMACKAATFDDIDSYHRIMEADHPSVQKKIGREIANFDKETWEKDAIEHVVAGNYFKFTQERGLYNFLMGTGNEIIVEASPTDTIWGIGMYEGEEGIENSDNWRGTNWLGIAIMRVRLMLFSQAPFDMKYMETK